jgi:formylglycine-generating enzyme required for sulfatase activity
MPYERKRPQADPPAPAVRGNGARRASIPAGSATLGLTPGDPRVFGWDNEFELHAVQVPAFSIDTRKVTNGEFLEFLTRGGYQERRLWSDPDWAWKEQEGIRHPSFWRKAADGQWLYHGMFSEFPLPIDWPAYVSHAEASAFARWRGGALPTEAQFHRAAYGTPSGPERDYPWGAEPPAPKHGNFDFLRWDPAPVGAYPLGDSAFGVSDLIGNGWEWTSSRFEPFPGFKAFPFYPGYSANFFDGKHYVMKGGSPRTAACTLRRSFRNWFQPHYPYVYAGFRLVEG